MGPAAAPGPGRSLGAGDQNFLRFFRELRQPFNSTDWAFVFEMVRDYLRTGGEIDPRLADQAQARLGLVEWEQLKGLVSPSNQDRGQAPSTTLKQMSLQVRRLATEMACHHTPLRRHLFRSTRHLLREYVTRGLIRATVPRRDPQPVWITMRPEEEELYNRIEEYISHFYQMYEKERKGLALL